MKKRRNAGIARTRGKASSAELAEGCESTWIQATSETGGMSTLTSQSRISIRQSPQSAAARATRILLSRAAIAHVAGDRAPDSGCCIVISDDETR